MRSVEVRSKLVEALQLDLVGPLPVAEHEHYANEVLSQRPSNWYLTGFLAPASAPSAQRGDQEGTENEEEQRGGQEDDQRTETPAARRAFFPSSMGLSVLVPPSVQELAAKVHWGDYTLDEEAGHWTRRPRVEQATLPLPGNSGPTEHPVPESGGLVLVVTVRPASADEHLPGGTRVVSVFLVNRRPAAPDVKPDEAFIFQAELRLWSTIPFVARPDLRGSDSDDFDDQVAELQFRDVVEHAVGHNVSAIGVVRSGVCTEVGTRWLPTAEVEKVIPGEVAGLELRMEELAKVPDAAALREKVQPLLSGYLGWQEKQPTTFEPERRKKTAEDLLKRARKAHDRIEAGLRALEDPLALEAFRVANRAVARAMRQRASHDGKTAPEDASTPRWYPFQLAFLLLNIPAIVDPQLPDRRVVDLLFFPTGGGKTEAYLVLAAFTMVLRRLRDPSALSSGLTVLMRYTLRLLTLDQLVRAATLVCALELERQADVTRLGAWPFEIGLWVGLAATPNAMGKRGDRNDDSARKKVNDFKRDPHRFPSPIPLEACPWCGWRFNKDSFTLSPNANEPEELLVHCHQRKCEFHTNKQPRGIPVVAVDEPLYRRLPAFVIATVDKFASLPWVGRTGALFGKVDRHDGKGFYGPCDPGPGQPLGGPLPPPDLVIQDELHLISGPLGTMVGLFETAIDALCRPTAHAPGPKIVASTATVRRAARQIRGLFGRDQVSIFPPPGPNRRDSFFARTVDSAQKNARLYLGVAAQGRNVKVVLLRTYLALLAAGQKASNAEAGTMPNPADPYLTLLGYFNALRELGGARRIVEDEVFSKLQNYGQRLRVGEAEGLFANRPKMREVEELTSRVTTDKVSRARASMGKPASDSDGLDVVLATNMISVGLDVPRLGLMVVTGQPKTAAEYIQATSRVGRDEEKPGLVVTLLNVHKPRDRSHYERFEAWHASFYRAVEVTSVTPFSPRAIDRGLAAVTVALARLSNPALTPALAAAQVAAHRQALERVAETISRRAEAHDLLTHEDAEALRQEVLNKVRDLLDSWQHVAGNLPSLQYGREVGGPPLLRQPLDPDLPSRDSHERKFKANRSLRDVEPAVNLWVKQ